MSSSSSAPAPAPPPAPAGLLAARTCFNSRCKEPRKEQPPRRRGWRLRSGEFAVLCDCCGCTYEQGTFCETFHASDPGWRSCEICGKRVHCGCIVSIVLYMILDTGGIECIGCARNAAVNAPNQIRSPFMPPQSSDRSKDLSSKGLSHMTGPYPGQWRQVPKIWTLASSQSELQRRISFEFERPNYHERVFAGGHYTPSSQAKKPEDILERISSGSPCHVTRDRYVNGLDSINGYNIYHREVACADNKQDFGQAKEENHMPPEKKIENMLSARKGVIPIPSHASSTGVNLEGFPNSATNSSLLPYVVNDVASTLVGLAAPYQLSRDSNDQTRDSHSHLRGHSSSSSASKQLYPNSQINSDIGCELQAQMPSGRIKADIHDRFHFHPRYCPKTTNEELQQISGDSNAVITPLFEKVLSASDAGKIGRLVLPKRCAEAYFPTISQPEGLPLKVQDSNGKEWVFQFRFWPNNNSRMYVLEGVTLCIQSMQLQAGDTVTFSRMDPIGRLVLGFRKASIISSEQDTQMAKVWNGISSPPEVNGSSTPESGTDASMRSTSGMTELRSVIIAEDMATQADIDKAEFIKKDDNNCNPSLVPTKRKGISICSKSKRLRIQNEDSIKLEITWEEAQILLRPNPNHIYTVVDIEGDDVEEFEEAPVLGKSTIFSTEDGERNQWAQCEICSKWHKLPLDALIPFRWICSDNTWDPERSLCTSAQEISTEKLAALMPTFTEALKKRKAKVSNEGVEVSEGWLNTLANLAILGEGEAFATSSQATKHPRHRPGCTCIVCIQPPSGNKGPKHQQSCTCNVCLTVRRFQTLALRRERRQSEKEAEEQQQLVPTETSPLGCSDDPTSFPPHKLSRDDASAADGESERMMWSPSAVSPLKANIDLNIQPEREEETSNPRVIAHIRPDGSLRWTLAMPAVVTD